MDQPSATTTSAETRTSADSVSVTMDETLAKLTRAEILQAMMHIQPLSREVRQSRRDGLIAYIKEAANEQVVAALEYAAMSKRPKRKHPQDQDPQRSGKRRRLDTETPLPMPSNVYCRDLDQAFSVPSEELIRQRHLLFYQRTSNKGVRILTCGICSRDSDLDDDLDAWESKSVEDLPVALLRPHEPHPAHDLTNTMLLERSVLRTDAQGVESILCCTDCASALDNEERPPLSLGNNMWTGDTPFELQHLTFPEALLLSLVYPRVYTFKLFPKVPGKWDESQLRGAMRGNVTSYELDMSGISNMLEGNLMPRPPQVLASVLSITFVGLGRIPKSWLRTTFRVRRHAVATALAWLIRNNHHYKSYELDQARLLALPEDDVPDEITTLILVNEDDGIAAEEEGGYVPLPDMDVTEDVGDEDMAAAEGGPDVIPIQVSGTVDTDLTRVTANELMEWGINNLWAQGHEGRYLVRHGAQPVQDFGRPIREDGNTVSPSTALGNFFERSFPLLYPYGRGGIEADRPSKVSVTEHVRWSLRNSSRRFRTHETFAFVVFSIIQRREALNSARIQFRRRNFEADCQVFATLTEEKFVQAKQEEAQGKPFSDPAVRLLREHLQATASRVMGSDMTRYQWRGMIRSTTIAVGPSNIWATINLEDIHNPIAQFFCGEEIDLDRFEAAVGPNSEQRARNIAKDPYASARFFHFMIRAIVEELFGLKSTKHQAISEEAIFGFVKAILIGDEVQGRGALHGHALIWLRNAPSSKEMRELLQRESFRERMRNFIKTHIRAYLPGLESKESMAEIPIERDVGWSRPPNPANANYAEEVGNYELRIVRTMQHHTCTIRRCLVSKNGQWRCKRRAPFELSQEDYVTEGGKWGQKRLYGYINGYCPSISISTGANNDIKLLTNGADTNDVTSYIQKYITKSQGKNSNLSAIMARTHAYNTEHPNAASLQDQQRMLLFRLVHAVNREQEIAAPMVMSYLMGWGDSYWSHRFAPVYWSSFIRELNTAYPNITPSKKRNAGFTTAGVTTTQGSSPVEKEGSGGEDNDDDDDDDEMVTVEQDDSGRFYAKCQFSDYALRGELLKNYNVMQFFTHTYDTKASKAGSASTEESVTSRRAGRPRNLRVPYLPEHPAHKTRMRMLRTSGHHTIANFIGKYFPRSDDPEIHNFYCASMLLLLKPWRNIRRDLKQPSQSWPDALESFRSSSDAPDDIDFTLSNIQFFHECETAVDNARVQGPASEEAPGQSEKEMDTGELGEDVTIEEAQTEITTDDVQALKAKLVSYAEESHGWQAVQIAQHWKIFADKKKEWEVHSSSRVHPAGGSDFADLMNWREAMVRSRLCLPITVADDEDVGVGYTRTGKSATVERAGQELDRVRGAKDAVEEPEVESAIEGLKPEDLNAEQRRAYDMIIWHLEQTLSGHEPPPLRMIVYGEGGTGKSRVIQTVTAAMAARGVGDWLVKAAYTGIAASLIGGKTTHEIGKVSVRQPNAAPSKPSIQWLQVFWKSPKYLILDEYSMLSKTFMAKLSTNVAIGRQQPNQPETGEPFGGLSVILFGDPHQFPPVGCDRQDPLYKPMLYSDNMQMQLGAQIYTMFTTVVILRQQMRTSDPVWREFLRRLRNGRVEAEDMVMLRTLLIGDPTANPLPNFDTEPWSEAFLVTPRHGVRRQWNERALRKHCRGTSNQLFVCKAEETVNGRHATATEQYAALSSLLQGKRKRKQLLQDTVEIAVGAKVLVTKNIETDLDIANGARGVVVGIIVHPDEPPITDAPLVTLKYLPPYILIKMDRTRVPQLPGLEPNVIPVEPQEVKQAIVVRTGQTTVKRELVRRQYAMTAAYAFTDYRSQGQTIPTLIVDIASPPHGGLSLFNLYVALSRGKGRDNIRILREWNPDLFLKGHDVDLLAEDDRLEMLDRNSKVWWETMRRLDVERDNDAVGDRLPRRPQATQPLSERMMKGSGVKP